MKYSPEEQNRILICDDDRTHLLILKETLVSQGYDVRQAVNGELALELFTSFMPHIVLLDVGMPVLDGFEVCSRIRATPTGANIPILMITGSDDQQSIEKAFEVGATDFLPKPIKWALIQHRVKYMLRSYEFQKSLQARENELKHIAYYDALTDLPNRQYFTDQLSKVIALSKRQQTTMAVMFIDLDSFKRVNDTLGHQYGDIVLKEIAHRLSKQTRESDIVCRADKTHLDCQVARLGGDEFTLLLSDCGGADDVVLIAKRILAEISETILVGQYSLVVTASIGISIYPVDGGNTQDLLKFSNMAMYEAKESGKNCYKLHSKELNERSINRLKLEEYMREALEQNKFELFYQPQINLTSGKIEGAEALLRLHHDETGIISPLEFIPVAEDTGLIVDIGYWAIQQACNQLVEWQNTAANSISISVNVSVKQINQPKFVSRLEEIIKKSGASPRLLDIELTESIIMNNPEQNIKKLKEIKTLGVGLSIDDFGTGYSSLSYLKKFPIDTLKIDRSFIIGICDKANNEDAAIVRAISAMAHALHLNIVVEGVETKEQLACIGKICTHLDTLIQGYYYAKPLPINVFSEFVLTHRSNTDVDKG